eukprot:TRINITY_DN11361_c1_g1_i1.p1 TRINITY_DN11361_c1_g1~~TRINITY_DN11361_c1_g1_i1.p1  ORF type:complete len:227 (+),score=31.10 TRINITY_DN11361_c1_g1_i1:34-714(+)
MPVVGGFCGECGKKTGTPACCRSVRQRFAAAVGLQRAAAAAATAVEEDDQPDSDHEEEAKELYVPGQIVNTPEGRGVIADRYDGGGLLAWFVSIEGKGDRLMEVEDLSEAQVTYTSQSPGLLSTKRKRAEPPPARISKGPIRRSTTSASQPSKQSSLEGIISKWFDDKGFGFISSEGMPDVWVSKRVCGDAQLAPGLDVIFDAEDTGHASGRLVCSAVHSVGGKPV